MMQGFGGEITIPDDVSPEYVKEMDSERIETVKDKKRASAVAVG